ncbi:RING/FYVE/PHD-type zinc finger family protein [Tanacetum coccineum]
MGLTTRESFGREIRAGKVVWAVTEYQFLKHTWKEVSHNLTEVNAETITELLKTEPLKWLVDSATSYCMLCNVQFHPIICSRHHYRFCGGLFCNECSKGRSLMPAKFLKENPQRVYDVVLALKRLFCKQPDVKAGFK